MEKHHEFPEEVESFEPCSNPQEHLLANAVRALEDVKVSNAHWPEIKAGFFVLGFVILFYLAILSCRKPKIQLTDTKKRE